MHLIVGVAILNLVVSIHAHSDHKGPHGSLSDSEHYEEGKDHNLDYDHEAFRGRGHGHDFDKLADDESKRRLRVIFGKIDKNRDGSVEESELYEWIERQRTMYMWDMLDDVIKDDDKNKDGKLSWQEYKSSHYGDWDHEASMDNELKRRLKRDENKFRLADENKDGFLERHEYVYFRHPEESIYKELQDVAANEVLDDIDQDGDRRINMKEFLGQYNDQTDAPEWIIEDRKHFIETLDHNKDGILDYVEVKAWVLPKREESRSEAKHLIDGADDDGDKKLSADEMVLHFNLFVGSMATNHGKTLNQHDEF